MSPGKQENAHLHFTVLLLPSLACSNSHTVGKISHKMQVLRMDRAVQYVRYVLRVKNDNVINTFHCDGFIAAILIFLTADRKAILFKKFSYLPGRRLSDFRNCNCLCKPVLTW